MTKTTMWLMALLAVSWTLTMVLWSENRALLGIVAARDVYSAEYVRYESFVTLVDVCETVNETNKRQKMLLYQARARMEEIDAIREENRVRARQEVVAGEARRRDRGRRHGQVRRGTGGAE